MTRRRYMNERQLTGIGEISRIGNDGTPFFILDSTLMHVQGGGQPSDVGLIEGCRVIKVVNIEGEVRHYTEPSGVNFVAGQRVLIEVDAAIRERNSKLHTGGHLIAAVAEAVYPQLKATGGHHWPGEARVEFQGENLPEIEAFSETISTEVRRAIGLDLPVKVIFDYPDERSIGIGEFPPLGCGGTHVESLAEIRDLTILKIKNKAGKLRVSYQI